MALNKVLEYCHALMSYPTLTDGPNLDLVYWIRDELDSYNIKSHLIYDQERKKANLFASVGPQEKEGILLSGHTDVVATEGQSWTTPPFQPTQRDNKIYARGAADMKGFIACALHSLVSASKLPLQRPLHLSLSYDEEIGCVGVHDLLVHLSERPVKPLLCIIGEPTSMQLASGHKGKITFEVMCKGRPGHSANPADALNAIHLASDFIQALRGQQDLLNKSTPQDTAYDVPHATIHVGTIAGGTAVNIVPESCKMVVEIRYIKASEAPSLIKTLETCAEQITQRYAARFSDVGITLKKLVSYPPLETENNDKAVRFLSSLLASDTDTIKVAFGAEGGLYSQYLGVPAIVCGPGSMKQGHKADEFIEIGQLRRCNEFLMNINEWLVSGRTLDCL